MTKEIKTKKSIDFAVIETGGKQYFVKSGDKIKAEKLKISGKENKVIFDKVLLLSVGDQLKIGNPYVKDAKIQALYSGEVRNKKITMAKYKSKTRQLRKKGHRQIYSEVIIGDF